MTDENRGEQGESVPLTWACANCVEGELPEQCLECGTDKQHVTPSATPVPTLTLTASPR